MKGLSMSKNIMLKLSVAILYISLIFLMQYDISSLKETIKMHCERIDNDESYRLKVAVNRYFNDLFFDIKRNKDNDECNPYPNNKFPNLMNCELSITGGNVNEKVLNGFIGNIILQRNMMASSSDLKDTFVEYSESMLSQMKVADFRKLDFMEVLDNYNIMHLFYGSELFLYEKSSFTLGGDKKEQLIVRPKVGYFPDSQYMWNTIKNVNVKRYRIENCGDLRYFFSP